MWPCGALASLLSLIYLQGWHDSPHVCMCVFQGAEGLPQLPETARDGYSDPTWTGLAPFLLAGRHLSPLALLYLWLGCD